MLHGSSVELSKDNSIPLKTRLGVVLFFVYLLVYSGFVLIGTFYPKVLGVYAFWGLNLAFVYGMGLIILAAIMGLVYNFFCTRYEDKMNKEGK
ncbi:MAG: DUF485 domain-containing protein [Ignavibacteriaceae bacterium]